ncbi:MAG: DNA polymerase III subunit gamma/tau [Microbacterium arborescens]
MTRRDDDALSWAGDDDPTLASGPPEAAVVADPAPATGTARDTSSAPSRSDPEAPPAGDIVSSGTAPSGDDDEGPAPASSAALVSLGILGGIYLLYTIGWIVGGLRINAVAGFIVAPTASLPAVIVAMFAPAVWFGVTYLLTRGRATWQRFAWLVAGAVLLVPWPFAMLGTVI